MITLWNGHRPVICCNDAWTISDMFEKRATIYSSRPRMIMMGDVINTTKHNQVCLKYDDQWRLHRKLSHSVVGTQVVRAYRGFQSSETKILLEDLLTRPDNYVPAIERYSCSIVSIVGWGRRIKDTNDPVAQRALESMEVVNAVIPGQAMMEMMPWLLELPSWINPLPKLICAVGDRLNTFWQEMTEEAAATSEDEDLFSKRLIKERDAGTINARELGNLVSNLIGGGVDTTSSSMISFILAMCVFPEVQKKAQEELDRVVGRSRIPDWGDEDSLPYITATATETLRWRTVTTLGGIPHAPTQDDEYRGYHIPKDTWIVGNVWAIHRNPKDYPDPDGFRPERFLEGSEWYRPHPSKKGHAAFGWGRRQCSGQPLAEQGLWLVTARFLWAFEIKPGVDEEGNEVKLDIFAYTPSENQRPEPFSVRFIPRSPEIRDLILREAERAREELKRFDGETKVRMS
ncbi:uncharacterized protein MYCFIDRAFT_40760 [Pseudocercospora fijiensis CIRAD86]|uniref:Cytochrome P450 n=1 Tax=Pseudocercospora fijiensis (strain CIRAD86) TaxID=383855 RepID=M3B858_PSEFD|nr:uncharacterized protein MYCFIDRAFT_40760 [Pseudocercospora fijiensis CIRAD86]EME85507.1 hypothetical protein MYCFIDRAFT_40760 [Pseudocercospora fijiensis CIRAD86]